jgi:hypothetical protein
VTDAVPSVEVSIASETPVNAAWMIIGTTVVVGYSAVSDGVVGVGV